MLPSSKPTFFCLIGPTASGKTALAIELVQRLPLEIISVDSAMVYRGMNIGTAKPTADLLRIAPHHLIDIRDPKETYSVGQFCIDAIQLIQEIIDRGKIPLFVGGTMMYFNALLNGLAMLPPANHLLREQMQQRAKKEGWLKLHKELTDIDPQGAAKIMPTDGTRIQRALEVYWMTGKTLSQWHLETHPNYSYSATVLKIVPPNRAILHQRIHDRFEDMMAQGFLKELNDLYERGDLSPALPALRSAGYKEGWAYLSGHLSLDSMIELAITATRQLAKRQITWLKKWPHAYVIEDTQQEICSIEEHIQKVFLHHPSD